MSYINNIKLNNLIRDVNQLETTVANMVAGGAPVIAGNIDMNNHSLTEVATVEFNSDHTLGTSGADLTYDNAVVVTNNNITTYETDNLNPSGDINMDGHYIVDAGKIGFNGSTYPLMIDGSQNLTWNGDPVVTSTNITTYETNNSSASSDLNMNGHSVLDAISLQITDSMNGHEGEKTSLVMLNGGLSTVSASNDEDVRLYIHINETAGQPSYTDFRGQSITNVNQITFSTGGDLFVDGTPQQKLIYGGNSVVLTDTNYESYITFPPDAGFVDTANANLNMSNFQLNNVSSLDFGGSTALTVDGSDDLTFNSQVVLRADNYETYITFPPDSGFVSTANANLNMANHEINNASSIDFGSSKVISIDANDNFTYNNEMVVVRPQYLPTYTLATNGSCTVVDTETANLPIVTISNDQINFSEGFRLSLNIPQFEFDTDDNYLFSIAVKLHTSQFANNGIMFQIKSDAFTTENLGSYSSLTGTFDFNPSTAVSGNVTINNMSAPVDPSTTEDYDIYVIVGTQGVGNDFSSTQINVSLQTLNSSVYDNLDLGTFGVKLDSKVLTNTSGNLTFDGNDVAVKNNDGNIDLQDGGIVLNTKVLTNTSGSLTYDANNVIVDSTYCRRYLCRLHLQYCKQSQFKKAQ